MSERNEEYIAAAKRLAAQARSGGVCAGEVAFDWDQDQIEADIYAALAAAHRAGKLEGLRIARAMWVQSAEEQFADELTARISELEQK